jgi:hypothetical protein
MPQTDTRFEQLWLSLWPLASDDLSRGIYRHSRSKALGKRYVEANPQAVSNLLVVDVDHANALERSVWGRDGWRPNVVVENPTNGHAHAVWALTVPVVRTEYASRKPLAYAASVTEGLRRSVDGDQGYSGLMTKNPDHASWADSWFAYEPYSLDQLAEKLTDTGHMPPPSWNRTRRKNPVGLGRNCAIFETARHWAYREVRRHWGDPQGLHIAIQERVNELNAGYSEPLWPNEAGHIARSISRWIVTRSRMWADGREKYEARLSELQSARGRMGGIASGNARRGGVTEQDILEASLGR